MMAWLCRRAQLAVVVTLKLDVDVPRSASAPADRVEENILPMVYGKKGNEIDIPRVVGVEWRPRPWG
jgi:hypothetical protein